MMKRVLKTLGIALVGLIALIAIISAFLSPKSHMERSIVINAPASAIFAQINTLKNVNNWQPWGKQDPNIKISYEGPESGVGSKMNWESEKMGNGSQWIIESIPDKHVKTGMQFGDMGGTNSSDINLETVEGGTKVTWTYDGDVTGSGVAMAAMGKIVNLFIDGMIGKDYEAGLNNLKKLAESQPQEQTTAPADSTQQKK